MAALPPESLTKFTERLLNEGFSDQSIFADLLHSEYGFSADDVVKILQAAERAAVKLNDVRNWIK